jgi:class 3 adenylate cyclase
MVPPPETKYAWSGDVSLAYQIIGDGPIDVVYLQGYCSHVDLNWDSPHLAKFLRGLAANSRLVITDRRGWGCSDRFSPYDIAPLETMADDLLAVLDAAGSERAVIFATQECSIVGALFAASYPERTKGLILCDGFATYVNTLDEHLGFDEAEWEHDIAVIQERWGRAEWVAHWPDVREREWFGRYARSSIPPGGLAAEMRRWVGTDLRSVYPTIHVPTLVLATTGGDSIHSAENGLYLASVIPGAKLIQHDTGRPWLHWYQRAGPVVAEVARFLNGIRDQDAVLDRVLATVLFTDIVGSTGAVVDLGDRSWGDLVQRHHGIVRALLARFRGMEVDTAGDGFFATFDGPGRAILCAQAIVAAVRPLGVEVRCGLHTGECETVDGKLAGLAVNVGARIGAVARPSEILLSETVKSLVAGSGLEFADRGSHRLRGFPDEWRLYAASSTNSG